MAIASALQLEAARVTPAFSHFNYDAMVCLLHLLFCFTVCQQNKPIIKNVVDSWNYMNLEVGMHWNNS